MENRIGSRVIYSPARLLCYTSLPQTVAFDVVTQSNPAMPSDLSYWLIAAPLKDGDPGVTTQDVKAALGDDVPVSGFEIPEFKVR